MESISITEFRKNLQEYISSANKGREIHVTRRGKTVAILIPPGNAHKDAQLALMALRKRAQVGDVDAPIGEDWEVDSDTP